MLDVGALLEDAENRGGMLEHVDELQEHNAQVWQQETKTTQKIKTVSRRHRGLFPLKPRVTITALGR